MGKKQHSKDRMFLTATEWKELGGKREAVGRSSYRPLAFDSCALSLQPYETPVCTPEGVLFDILNLFPYVQKHKKNPITGHSMTAKEIVRLTMAKNAEGKWHCPVTFKEFTDHTHVVAVKPSGNVYAYEAVEELNIRRKNWTDLMTGESFTRKDIITLQDPSNAAHMALRDISNFKHLEEVRAEEQARVAGASAEEKIASSIRTNASTEMVLAEFQRQQREREEAEALRAAQAEAAAVEREKQEAEEEEELRRKGGGGATKRRRSILIEDLHPGKSVTTGKAAASFTATGVDLATGNTCRTATEEETREVRYKFARKLGKKGYVQLQTSLGNLNLEIHCDFVPQTAENFLGLCLRGFYDGLSFHRVIKGFMAQTGCPRGDGRGGETVWSLGGGREEGKEGGATMGFKDEFDSRLTHDKRGVLSMANSGKDTNRSQFFITFKSCRHLDNKHTVFGRVVGGMDVLGRLEGVEVGKEDRPKEEVKVLKAVALVNPLEESDAQFDAFVEGRRQEREATQAFRRDNNALGFTRKGKGKGEEGNGVLSAREAADAERTEGFYSQPGPQKSVGEGVGRYLGSGAGQGRLGGGTVLPQRTAVVGSEAAYMQEVVGPAVHVKESSKAFQELAAQEERKGGSKKRRVAGAFGNFEGW